MLRADGLEGRLWNGSRISELLEQRRKFDAHLLHLWHDEIGDQELHQEFKEFPKFGRRERKVVERQRSRIVGASAEFDDVSRFFLLITFLGQRPVVLDRDLDGLAVVRRHRLATAVASHAATAVGSTRWHLWRSKMNLNFCLSWILRFKINCVCLNEKRIQIFNSVHIENYVIFYCEVQLRRKTSSNMC